MASRLQAAVALDSFARRWSRSVTSTSRCGRARAVERGAVAGRRAQAGRATRARASNSTVVLPAVPAPSQVVFRARRRRRQGRRVQLRAVRQAAHAHAPADGGAAAAAAVRTGLAAAVQRRRHRRHEDDVAGRRAAAQAAHLVVRGRAAGGGGRGRRGQADDAAAHQGRVRARRRGRQAGGGGPLWALARPPAGRAPVAARGRKKGATTRTLRYAV
jgi:hypothetical protein